jgi:hypothetical protein
MALSVADTIEHGLVRCVVDRTDDACRAIESSGFNCLQTEILRVELPERIGALSEFAEILAEAGVNLLYFYGCLHPSVNIGILFVRVLDLELAEEALSKAAIA